MRLVAFLLLVAFRLSGQTACATATYIQTGDALPATCSKSLGEVFLKTSSAVGLYFCREDNTWAHISGISSTTASTPCQMTSTGLTCGTVASAFALTIQAGADQAGLRPFEVKNQWGQRPVWISPAGNLFGHALYVTSLVSSPGVVNLKRAALISVAVSGLPTCDGSAEGTVMAVNDSTTATWGQAVTGGGANKVMAYCNGSAWTVAAK